jgi:hypothetical protein
VPESRHEIPSHGSSARVTGKLEDGAKLFASLIRAQAEPLVEAALEDLKATKKAAAFEAAAPAPPPEALWHETLDWLTLMELAGIQDSAEWVGLGQVEGAALEHAQARAGELIGMRLDPDLGEWIPNPNPDLALSRATRSRIERVLAKGIDKGWSVDVLRAELNEILDDPARAATIARTEAGYAYNRGTATNWQALGISHVRIYDNEGPNSCEACHEANGQTWTVEHFLENLLEHPNCVRTAWPVDAPGTDAN